MKADQCPSVDEWIKQQWDIYTTEYYSAIKKKKILPFVTAWVGLENIMLREIRQSEKVHRILNVPFLLALQICSFTFWASSISDDK